MKIKKLFTDFRIILWLIVIVMAIVAINPKFSNRGIVITSINASSPLNDVLMPGDEIYKINDDLASTSLLERRYSGEVRLKTSKGVLFYQLNNSTLGITGVQAERSNLHFGLDIRGGIRAIIEPENATEEMVQSIITTMQTRINVYGLKESLFRPIWSEGKAYIQIEIAGGTKEELMKLLEHQGKFEAYIPLKIKDGKIEFNNKKIDVSVDINKTFEADGITFRRVNDSYVEALVYTGKDIQMVYLDPQHSWFRPTENGYSWGFQVLISNDGAERFKKITMNIPVRTGIGTEKYLEEPIKLYLDGKLTEKLSIGAGLKGQLYTTPAITGGAKTKNEGMEEKRRLQSILRSGSLPTKIKVVQMDEISPRLGARFLSSAMFAGLAAILTVSLIVFIRYRKPRMVIPMILVSLSEVVIILGASVLIGWTIDLAAIAGVVAAVGTGVDSQIMILDESIMGKKQEWSLKERLKRAFFMIFGAAGTTIGAMFPLLVLGFGMLRGFAITTMIGVLTGVLITRPAFGRIVEYLLE